MRRLLQQYPTKHHSSITIETVNSTHATLLQDVLNRHSCVEWTQAKQWPAQHAPRCLSTLTVLCM